MEFNTEILAALMLNAVNTRIVADQGQLGRPLTKEEAAESLRSTERMVMLIRQSLIQKRGLGPLQKDLHQAMGSLYLVEQQL